ncbi:hypothetical protein KRX19_09250 [Cardiobacteriaceae bacterium TAE3-ERU3]|nr:hypothetical protein [Cardiobacteriaceae bacterium TAE3-ERU3]
MQLRWSFWILWVIVNAITSFFWAVFLGNSLPYLAGILSGVVCFIVFYTLLDGYLAKHQHFSGQRALVRGVYIKAGLQVLNLFAINNLPPFIPEIWAGSAAIMLVDKLVHESDSFLFALLTTLLTGAFLSVIVGAISLVIWVCTTDKAKPKN